MYTVGFIAEQLGGRIIGNNKRVIKSISTLEDIRENSIVFIKNKRNFRSLVKNKQSICVVVDFDPAEKTGFDFIVISREEKNRAFIKLLSLFEENWKHTGLISEKALISPHAKICKNVTINDFVSIGDDTIIKDNTYIGANTYIGDHCSIGRGIVIHPNVSIYKNTIIEDNVILHSGAVIGSDGFSYENIDGKNQKVPQIGGVHIEKNVEVGSNTTIDKATIGYTIVGENTKIDNLVQIAHNCVIGKNTIICALCGIAGSVTIGDNVILAGAVGLADHIMIEDNVIIGPKAGVMKKVVKKGSYLLGAPAGDYREEMEFFAMKSKLKEMYNDIKMLKQKFGL